MEPARSTKSGRRGYIVIDRNTCKGCALCMAVCPRQIIGMSESLNEKGYYPAEVQAVDAKRQCNACCSCALICPDVAIEVYRE